MNYMTFEFKNDSSVLDIQNYIQALDLEVYSQGKVIPQYDEAGITFVCEHEEFRFYIESSPDGTLLVSSPEVIGFFSMDKILQRFMWLTFEYLAEQCGATVIQCDSIDDYPKKEWSLNQDRPHEHIHDFISNLDARSSPLDKWYRKAHSYFNHNSEVNNPSPF